MGVEGGRPSSSARGDVGKRQGLSAPRLATTVELAFALLSWLGGRQARTAMASGMGTDPGEPVGVRFAVTESLVGANIAI